MLKKTLSLSLIFILSILVSGCTIPGTDINIPLPWESSEETSESPVEEEPVTLTYWGLFEPYEVYEPLIEQYQEENPHVTINYEEKVFDDLNVYKDTLLSKLQLQETSPDILRVHSTWVSSFSTNLAPSPEGLISAEDISSDFYTTSSATSVLNNNVYAVPLMYDSLALVYNRDLFNEANVTPPTTWTDFIDLAEQLTVYDGQSIQVAGAAIGSAENVAHFSDILGLLMNQSQVELPRDMNTTVMSEIITFYTNFVTQTRVWDRSLPYSPVAFANGRVAMIFVPSWQLLNILESNPSLNVGVVEVPQVVSEEALTEDNFANYWVETVNANSPNSEESWRFLTWLAEQEQLKTFYNSAASRRPFGEPYPRVSLQSEIITSSFIVPYYAHADNARTRKIAYGSGNNAYIDVFKNVVEGVLNGGNVESLLQTAEQEYQRLEQQP